MSKDSDAMRHAIVSEQREHQVSLELAKLVTIFLADAELVPKVRPFPESAPDLRGRLEAYACRGLELSKIDAAGTFFVPGDKVWPFLEALLRPYALQAAERSLPTFRELEFAETEDGTQRIELPETVGIFKNTVFDESSLGSVGAEFEEQEDLGAAEQRARSAAAELFSLLKRHGSPTKDWARRVEQASRQVASMIEEGFVPMGTEDAASWAFEHVERAFALLEHERTREHLLAYARKLMEMADMVSGRDLGSSRASTMRRQLEREAARRSNRCTVVNR